MNEKVLQIVIKAKNEAEKELNKLSASLKNNQKLFKGMATAGTVAFAGIGLVLKKSIDNANEAVSVQAQLDAVLKSTGHSAGLYREDILEQASALQKLTTYGDEAIVSAQNLLLTFTNVKGPIFQNATATVLDMSTALGQDLKSSSIQLGKALNDPINGITALSRVGVSFTEDQKEMIRTLQESGDVMGAQKIILDELAKEFGGSAQAQAKTFAGQIEQLKNTMGDLLETIGIQLLPILQSALDKVKPIIEKIMEWVTANPELTRNILLATFAISGLVAVVGALGLVLPAIITGFTLLSGPAGIIIGIIIALGIAVTNVTKIFLIFQNDMGLVWAGVKEMFKESIDYIIELFNPLFKVIDKVKNALSSIASGVKGAVSKVSSKLSGKATGGGVQVGQPYIVGEKGPELFTPASNGSITPNYKMAGAGGLNLTINMNGGTYLDDNVAEKIGDQIIQVFKRTARF